MKPMTQMLAILTLLMLAPALPVSAQLGDLFRESVLRELDRTDALIEHVQSTINASSGDLARNALATAVDIQRQAREQFDLEFLRSARQLTFSARDFAKRALVTDRVVEEGAESLLRRLERADENFNRLTEFVKPTEDSPLSSVTRVTGENLRKAWELHRSGELLASLRLVVLVERSLWRIGRAVRAEMRWDNAYEQQALRVQESIHDIRDLISACQSASAETLLNQAEDALVKADELSEKGRTESALRTLGTAEKLAQDAREACDAGGSLEATYERLRGRLDKIEAEVEQGDKRARSLFDQANDQLKLARNHLDEGNSTSATAALRAAQLAIRQLTKYLRLDEF